MLHVCTFGRVYVVAYLTVRYVSSYPFELVHIPNQRGGGWGCWSLAHYSLADRSAP